METKTIALLKACTELTSYERGELAKGLKEFENKPFLEQKNYTSVLNKSLGPMNDNKCALCGK